MERRKSNLNYEEEIEEAKRAVSNQEEPFKSIAFKVILSKLIESKFLPRRENVEPVEKEDLHAKRESKKKNKIEEDAVALPAQEIAAFEIPESIKQGVNDLKDRQKLPVLWYFSTVKSMTIREFLNALIKNKFQFSHTWLPDQGSNFTKRIVQEDKMLEEDGKNGREKKYKLSVVGNLKVQKLIAELEKQKTELKK